MKESSDILSENIFTHFPTTEIKRSLIKLFVDIVRKRALAFKRQILNGLATLGIGTVFFIVIYLFLIQLAEYGWQ